ncbi:MAG: hypothetical protein KME64_39200 [Scytonematopsis contorta HA4267-MV1]|jgi:hypothetical protein|nr:hypothetical protein [Scytonematopsis contorta HA4267-MV1]
MSSLKILNYGSIRITGDNRYSVFDTIEVLAGKKNPRDAWKSLCESYSEVVGKTDNFQFPGFGQRLTPVADKESILYIIGLLPGAVGKAYREDAAKVMLEKLENRTNQHENYCLDETPSVKQITEAVQVVLSIAGLHPNLIAGVAANAICNSYPQLASAMEEVKKALPLPTEDRLLTASDLAELYYEHTNQKLSQSATPRAEAIAMNKLLEEKGLQVKNCDGKPDWLPTQLGTEFSQIILQTGKTNDGTYQQLRWFPTVIDLLH